MNIIKRIVKAGIVTFIVYFICVPLLGDRVMADIIYGPVGFFVIFGFLYNEISFVMQ